MLPLLLGIVILLIVVAVVAVVAVIAAAAAARRTPRSRCMRPPPFQGQSKCFSCEAALPPAADLYGNRCLDCEGPSFRYLTETIGTERHHGLEPRYRV